ncbi:MULTISPECIES: beta-glucoside-specific PTS transporter subunit IIABC [unclassified Enterococcus]|uniref:beta-glucoside-specific PTS transporter subunit IIABC n=1 Tax=unclassified Enterococcus TaxID=2608891 RepID=UPI001906D289|nr:MULTISPECIES: beta-glucoside-specific PTS transporter subunit IIABC [unclassified Enterococcus]MBK0038836.1 PTS glucose transporter subunit IIA [Enterococcus sp. S52]MBK0070861.1 PTS glucose transporter subunit IIA [Enterococcus sp. S53]MBK0142528.1 PTS glucose transporter subunit IIA [Enterococcus sp. S76]MBK0146223.1 PTS glucose transporter subunit IIA [Enterococcus sp. S77]
MGKYTELASTLIDLVGGKQNITAAWHCVTRLRFNVNDDSKIKIDTIKKTRGVMGAQFSGDQFQIIIGNDVSNVFDEVENQLGTLSSGKPTEKVKNGNIINTLMETISGIFTPALPALVGTGLLKGVLALCSAFNWLSVESTGYQVLNIVADCAFYFLPFILAVSSAKKFKTNEYLALCVAGALLYPTMTAGSAALMAGETVNQLRLFGFLPIPYLAYNSSVIPIILATYALKYVYSFVKKWMPATLTTMFTPMLTLLFIIPLTLIALGPIGTYIGGALAGVVTWLFHSAGFVGGAIIGAFYPLLVMTGMHWALSPIMVDTFAKLGFDNTLMPAMLAATFAMAGATFGVFFKSKNKDMKQLSLSAGISATLGITEPALYGVTLNLKRPLYAAIISGGIVGIFFNLFDLKTFGMAMPGLIALPGYVDAGNGKNIIIAVIGSLAAFFIAAILTWVLGFNENNEIDDKFEKNEEMKLGVNLNIKAPATGKVIPIETVSDITFSEQIMGYTVAIEPENNQITSPVDGEVIMIAETKHAIGLKSSDGLEILLHLGIDTVELRGNGFESKVKVGDHVSVGDFIMSMDIDFIKRSGYDPIVLTIVTNSNDYLKVLPIHSEDMIKVGDELSVVVS